jgi:hypothetical protein
MDVEDGRERAFAPGLMTVAWNVFPSTWRYSTSRVWTDWAAA